MELCQQKGIGGAFPLRKEIGIAWHYRWGIQEDDASTFEHDYVPMFWGGVKEDGLNKIFQMELTNHVLAFNEPDGKEQANMTPEAALEKYPEILKLGLRTGSPACKEGQWKTGLPNLWKAVSSGITGLTLLRFIGMTGETGEIRRILLLTTLMRWSTG